MTPFEKRPYVRGIYVSKYVCGKANNVQYDIAVITAGDRYAEYEVVIRQTSLTYWVLKRLRQLFINYRMDRYTDVVVSDTMNQQDVMTMYLQAVSVHIGFTVHIVSFDAVFDRICGRYPKILLSKSGKILNVENVTSPRYAMQSLWRGLVEKKLCPWITSQYNEQVQQYEDEKRYKKQLVRLGAFYLLVKAVKRDWRRFSKSNQE